MPNTLIEMLYTAQVNSPQKGFTFLAKDQERWVSFKNLWCQAGVFAEALKEEGIKQGDNVIILLSTSPEFAYCYFALQMLGASCCVLPNLKGFGNKSDGMDKLLTIAKSLNAKTIIHDNDTPQDKNLRFTDLSTLKKGGFDKTFASPRIASKAQDIAIIQASSGSTGEPKCIALSHQNAIANLHQIGTRLATTPEDKIIGWLPLYHDMGLFSCFLFPILWQINCVLMTPMQFIRRPSSWLKAISKYKGTLAAAPNFAYNLVTQKTKNKEMEDLDLSSWRMAMCGAEPIQLKTLESFKKRFKKCGFSDSAFTPSYGLAEASVCVSLQNPESPLHYECIDRAEVAKHHEAKITLDSQKATICVSCGTAVKGTTIQIRNEKGQERLEGIIGEVWVSGPSVMQKYIGLEDKSSSVLVDGWLKTGDLGYLRNNELFITGRKKELIIIRGHNYAPTEFELFASEVTGVAKDKVVAFGFLDEQTATENLIIAFERDRTLKTTQTDVSIAEAVKLHVAKHMKVLAYQVVVLPKNTIKKTSSGKIKRAHLKDHFMSGSLAKA